jgi:hypothetical protein
MKKIMILMMVVGSFWVGQVWADMERVSVVEVRGQITEPVPSNNR